MEEKLNYVGKNREKSWGEERKTNHRCQTGGTSSTCIAQAWRVHQEDFNATLKVGVWLSSDAALAT